MLRPTGSQPARLYGLAKVHKPDVPLRPIVSMPGSAYDAISVKLASWLKVLPEACIGCNIKKVNDTVRETILSPDETLISLDVESLFTNVPAMETIQRAADLLYDGTREEPPIDKETFVDLLKMVSCDILISTPDGIYRQIDGVAMGSAVGPLLANIFMSAYDNQIGRFSKFYFRYVDDIFMTMIRGGNDYLLNFVNTFHENLKFTIDVDNGDGISFLDSKFRSENDRVLSSWFVKKTDTGVIMNFNAVAPRLFKSGLVSGFVHRIFNTTSTWFAFDKGMMKAMEILRNNQYPKSFVQTIINSTLSSILSPDKNIAADGVCAGEKDKTLKSVKKAYVASFSMDYRGVVSDRFAKNIRKAVQSCNIYFTTRKLRTCLTSLKSPVPETLKSHVVYNICCPACNGIYIGQTTRHLFQRVKEHARRGSPVSEHFKKCGKEVSMEDVEIIATETHERTLLALEAVYIRRRNPSLNTKDEFRSRTLHYRF